MRLLRARKANPAELKRDQQRQARMDAPTLRVLVPAATQVCVEIAFDGDEHLVKAPRTFTLFPPAQAHFVYGCAFGDCDGTFNLNEEVFSMLHSRESHASGVRSCTGHRLRHHGTAPLCGLQVTYSVTACYQADRPTDNSPLALA